MKRGREMKRAVVLLAILISTVLGAAYFHPPGVRASNGLQYALPIMFWVVGDGTSTSATINLLTTPVLVGSVANSATGSYAAFSTAPYISSFKPTGVAMSGTVNSTYCRGPGVTATLSYPNLTVTLPGPPTAGEACFVQVWLSH